MLQLLPEVVVDKILCPSMMCADYGSLKDSVMELEKAGTDIFHCDIMDGCFVPNITMGILDIKAIRKYTNKLIDAHLMIENPLNKVDMFIKAGADLIYVHPEAEDHTKETLNYLKSKGKLAGLAINPETTVEMIYEMLELVDYLLVMSVNPGFAGQSYLEFVTGKIKALIALKDKFPYKIIVDGGITLMKIRELSDLGVDGFILGTSVLFEKEKSYLEIMKEIRGL